MYSNIASSVIFKHNLPTKIVYNILLRTVRVFSINTPTITAALSFSNGTFSVGFYFVGGFAFVYVVQDIQSDNEYALKRLLGADKQACNNIIRELNIHKQISGHPNIVKFVAASFIDRTNSAQGNAEYLLVSELCKGKPIWRLLVLLIKYDLMMRLGGSLIDCLDHALEPETVLKLMYQATQGVKHMHLQSVPITHLDIKVNINYNYLF